MNATDQILRFSRYLSSSWCIVLEMLENNEDLVADWKQSSWETLVESSLLESGKFLEVYADGAECNGASSRVWIPEALPTHRIQCHALEQEPQDLLTGQSFSPECYSVDCLGAIKSGRFAEEPPFDCVLLYRGDAFRVSSIRQLSFFVMEISDLK